MSTEATTTEEAAEPKDFLGMSDEDFLKINSPTATAEEASGDESNNQGQENTSGSSGAVTTEDTTTEDKAGDESAKAKEDDKKGADQNAAAGDENKSPPAAAAAPAAVVDPKADPKAKPKAEEQPKAVDKKPDAKADPASPSGSKPKADGAQNQEKKDDPAAAAKPLDYEAIVKQIMTPFKANGRTIELKTPEEAIRLMQMGAGYGRKIQDLQPHLKVLRMLEKNDLLDEGKLSFLIDINQKNPDAIKKIIKEAGIDPLDLNISDNASYIPKNHSVSDDEMRFHDALGDIQSHPTGGATLKVINETWDEDSKSALWSQPQILKVIQDQRDNGIYDQIVAEIDRQKLLGHIPSSTPFLQAYKLAGDHLQATNGFKAPPAQAAQIQTQTGVTQQPQVIATRAEAPKAQVTNSDKAAAASPTKTNSARKATTTVNPLAMADDDFLKQFNGRL